MPLGGSLCNLWTHPTSCIRDSIGSGRQCRIGVELVNRRHAAIGSPPGAHLFREVAQDVFSPKKPTAEPLFAPPRGRAISREDVLFTRRVRMLSMPQADPASDAGSELFDMVLRSGWRDQGFRVARTLISPVSGCPVF